MSKRVLNLFDRAEGFHDARAHVLVGDDFDQVQDVPVGKPFFAEFTDVCRTARIR